MVLLVSDPKSSQPSNEIGAALVPMAEAVAPSGGPSWQAQWASGLISWGPLYFVVRAGLALGMVDWAR